MFFGNYGGGNNNNNSPVVVNNNDFKQEVSELKKLLKNITARISELEKKMSQQAITQKKPINNTKTKKQIRKEAREKAVKWSKEDQIRNKIMREVTRMMKEHGMTE